MSDNNNNLEFSSNSEATLNRLRKNRIREIERQAQIISKETPIREKKLLPLHYKNALKKINYYPEDKYALQEYVKSGSEINEELRNTGLYSNLYKNTIPKIDQAVNRFTIGDLFNDVYGDYIKVYRVQTVLWSNDNNNGYVSCSNIPIPFGGSHNMEIYIPKETGDMRKIMLWLCGKSYN